MIFRKVLEKMIKGKANHKRSYKGKLQKICACDKFYAYEGYRKLFVKLLFYE